MIRPATPADVHTIVEVHLESFPGFFLTFLGPSFLRAFYQGILDDPSGIGFVFEQQGRVVGFVMGTAQPAGFYRRLIRQRLWRFAAASVVPALRNPRIIPRLFRALGRPGSVREDPTRGTLMSIAVSPQAQGGGVGRALVRAFIDEAARRGLKTVDLTTDKHDNAYANAFYLKQGFEVERDFTTPEGRAMYEYVYRIP